MRRVVILGCAGTGKSQLAEALAKKLGAPAICLDAIWRPEWARNAEPFRQRIAELHAGDAWVSDGNFAMATFDLRLPRADLVVWLHRPRWLCAWRAVRRTFRAGERHRPRDLIKVLRFIEGFDRINRPRIEALRNEHGPDVPVTRLGSDAEVAAFLGDVELRPA